MSFNFGEFLDFIKYFLPQSYTIAAAISLLIWITSQIDIVWQARSYILGSFSFLFLSAFLLSICLPVTAVLARLATEPDIYLQILISKWYLITLILFFTTAMVIILFSPRSILSNIAITFYIIVYPAIFVLHLYDFMQLTQVALSQQ